MKYNKLVRDKIPEILKNKGIKPKIHIADDPEYFEALKNKLKEEVDEFFRESNEEEIVDILEVVDAIIDYKNFKKEDLKFIKVNKANDKGRFNSRIILEES